MNEWCSFTIFELLLVRKINCPCEYPGPPTPALSKAALLFFCFICSCFWVRFCLNKGFQGQERRRRKKNNNALLKTSGVMAEYRTCIQKTSEPLPVWPQTSQLIPLNSCLSVSQMRIRVLFPLPTSCSGDENQMKTFQTTGAVQLFVVRFMGFRLLGNQGNKCFKTIWIKQRQVFIEAILHEEKNMTFSI